jgi:hypothetical protein
MALNGTLGSIEVDTVCATESITAPVVSLTNGWTVTGSQERLNINLNDESLVEFKEDFTVTLPSTLHPPQNI